MLCYDDRGCDCVGCSTRATVSYEMIEAVLLVVGDPTMGLVIDADRFQADRSLVCCQYDVLYD